MDEQQRTEQGADEVEGHKKTLAVTENDPPETGDDAEESDVEAHVARQPPTNY